MNKNNLLLPAVSALAMVALAIFVKVNFNNVSDVQDQLAAASAPVTATVIGTMHHHSDAKDGKLGSTTCGSSPVNITNRRGTPVQVFDSPANTICALSSIKLTTSDTVQVMPAGPTITGPGTFNMTTYGYNDKGTGVIVLPPPPISGKILPEKLSYSNDIRYDYADFANGPNSGVFKPLNIAKTSNAAFPAATCLGVNLYPGVYLPIKDELTILDDDSDHDGTYNYSLSAKTTYVKKSDGRQIQCLTTDTGTIKNDILFGGVEKFYQIDANSGTVQQTLLTTKPTVVISSGASDAPQMNGNISTGNYSAQLVASEGTLYIRGRPALEMISNTYWIKLDKAATSQVTARANFIATTRTTAYSSSNHFAQDLSCSSVATQGGGTVTAGARIGDACTFNITIPAGDSSVGGIKFSGPSMIGTAFSGSVIAQ